jgi:hypothetical protein
MCQKSSAEGCHFDNMSAPQNHEVEGGFGMDTDDNGARDGCTHEEPIQPQLSRSRLIQRSILDYFRMGGRELIEWLTLEANPTLALRTARNPSTGKSDAPIVDNTFQRAMQTSLINNNNVKEQISGERAEAEGQDGVENQDDRVTGESPTPASSRWVYTPEHHAHDSSRRRTEVSLQLHITTSTDQIQTLSFDTLDLWMIPSAAQHLVDYVAILDENPRYPDTFEDYRRRIEADSNETDDGYGIPPLTQGCSPTATIASGDATVLDAISDTPREWIRDPSANIYLANDSNCILSLAPNVGIAATDTGVDSDHCVATSTPSPDVHHDQLQNALNEELTFFGADSFDWLDSGCASPPMSGQKVPVAMNVACEDRARISTQDDETKPFGVDYYNANKGKSPIATPCFSTEKFGAHRDGQDHSTRGTGTRKSRSIQKPSRSRKSPAQRARLHKKAAAALKSVHLGVRKQKSTSGA